MVSAMMPLISTAGHIGAAAVQRARHVPPAARSDDQRLRAWAHRIRQRRTLQREIAAIVRSEVGEIEFRNRRGGIGIDHDAVAAVGLADDADPRKIVPLVNISLAIACPLA